MHISYKPLWHTLIERNMRKEDLRLAAGLTTNMIANMGKEGKHISMDTLARICETLDCGIMDVIDGILSREKKEVDKVIISAAELNKYFGKDATPREMKDQIMSLLDAWKEKQPRSAPRRRKRLTGKSKP